MQLDSVAIPIHDSAAGLALASQKDHNREVSSGVYSFSSSDSDSEVEDVLNYQMLIQEFDELDKDSDLDLSKSKYPCSLHIVSLIQEYLRLKHIRKNKCERLKNLGQKFKYWATLPFSCCLTRKKPLRNRCCCSGESFTLAVSSLAADILDLFGKKYPFNNTVNAIFILGVGKRELNEREKIKKKYDEVVFELKQSFSNYGKQLLNEFVKSSVKGVSGVETFKKAVAISKNLDNIRGWFKGVALDEEDIKEIVEGVEGYINLIIYEFNKSTKQENKRSGQSASEDIKESSKLEKQSSLKDQIKASAAASQLYSTLKQNFEKSLQLKRLAHDNVTLTKRMDLLEQTITELAGRLEGQSDQLNTLEGSHNHVAKRTTSLESQQQQQAKLHMEAVRNILKLGGKHNGLKVAHDALSQKHEKLAGQHVKLLEAHDKFSIEAMSGLAQALSNSEYAIDQVAAVKALAEKRLTDLIVHHEEEMTYLHQSIASLDARSKKEAEGLHNLIKLLDGKIQTLNGRVDTTNKHIKDLDHSIELAKQHELSRTVGRPAFSPVYSPLKLTSDAGGAGAGRKGS